MSQKYCVVFKKHCVVVSKHCFVFQELFVAFADMGHRTLEPGDVVEMAKKDEKDEK